MGAPLNLQGFQAVDRKIVSPSYRAGIDIYPFTDSVFPNKVERVRRLNWERDLTEGTVTSLSWGKRLGQPSGQWGAQIRLGRESTLRVADGDVLDGDWCDLTILRNGIPFPLCRGIVDVARESSISAGGATVRTVNLSGRDHGALFENQIAWNQMFAQSLSELTTGILTNSLQHRVGGSPDEMFQALIEATFSAGSSATRSAWTLPSALQAVVGQKTFGKALKVATEPLRGALFNINLWTQPGQSLHQTLSQWCNPLLNEWRYDLLSADDIFPVSASKDLFAMGAVIRERPFINTVDGMNSPWWTNRTWTIPDWLITDSDVGRSGHERYTIFEVVADWQFGTSAEQTGLAPPLWSSEDVETRGVKPYLESTMYIAQAGGDWVGERAGWQRQLVDWYAISPYFLSGTITFGCMLPEIKIGDRLVIDTGTRERNSQYYIEGVDHQFQWTADGKAGPRTSTTLTVTRGWVGADESLMDAVTSVSLRFEEAKFA